MAGLEAKETVCASLVARGPQTQSGCRLHGAGPVGDREVVMYLREGAKNVEPVKAQ